jgi:hypothetical protein
MRRLIGGALLSLALLAGGYYFYTSVWLAGGGGVKFVAKSAEPEVSKFLLKTGLPYRWEVTGTAAMGGGFTSALKPLNEGLPVIPLDHAVANRGEDTVIVTTTGDFEGKAKWVKATGGEEPLVVTTTVQADDVIVTEVDLRAATMILDGAKIEYSAMQAKSVSADDTSFAMAPGDISIKSAEFEAGIEINGVQGVEKPNGESTATIGLSNITLELFQESLSILAVDVAGENKINGGVMTSLGSISFSNVEFGPSPTSRDLWADEIKLSMDMGPLPANFEELLMSIYESETDEQITAAVNAVLKEIDKPILLRERIVLRKADTSTMDLNLRIDSLSDASIGGQQDVMALVQKLSAAIEMDIAEVDIPDSVIPMFQSLINQGHMRFDGARVKASVTYANGKVVLNNSGQSMDVLGLVMSNPAVQAHLQQHKPNKK